MARSRSRSPKRPERRRSRSRERRPRHRRSRSRSPVPRFRSRSPNVRRRSRSHSPRRRSPSPNPMTRRRTPSPHGRRSRDSSKELSDSENGAGENPTIDTSKLEGLSEEDRNMMSLMGFVGFDSTKGKKVPGNDTYSTNIVRKRRYRQYMNRRGGFNRPLDFIA